MSQTDRTTGLVGYSGMKVPVRVVSIVNVAALTGLLTVDGQVLLQDDRVLLTAQTSSIDNGIYVADTGAWNRAQDCDGSYDLRKGSVVYVTDGAANSGFWYSTAANPVVIGTSALTWSKASTILATITAYAQTLIAAATAAAFRVLMTPLTTKGDLWVFGAADDRLAAGADGTVPMARSADAKGLAYVAALNKAIYGLTYANNGGDSIDIAAGGAMDATGAYQITGAALTKNITLAWVVGNAQGMLDTGVVGNSDYYLWAIARPDTGVVDYLASLSSTAPTMPANYTVKRLIGWFKRVGATNVLFHTYETEGGGIEMNWDVPTLDVNLANTLTTARRTDAVKVPLNFSTIAHLSVLLLDGAVGNTINWICCPDQTDAAPSSTVAPLSNANNEVINSNKGIQIFIRTSAAGLIAARSNTATIDLYAVSTMGFRWARRN